MSTLIPVSAIYGIAAVLVFRRLTERAAIRRSVNRILAHVMELGLFLDSPGLVMRAQRELLLENLRLLRLVMLPSLILAGLFVPMYLVYGHAPLAIGEASVITVQMKDFSVPVRLEAPEGTVVETPGVRAVRDGQISWRVRPVRLSSGDFRFHVGDRMITAGYVVRDPAIQSIEIRYPAATSWLLWFILVSSVSAGALRLYEIIASGRLARTGR